MQVHDDEIYVLIENVKDLCRDSPARASEVARALSDALDVRAFSTALSDLSEDQDSDEPAWRDLLRRMQRNARAVEVAGKTIEEYRRRFPPSPNRGAETLYIKTLLNAGRIAEGADQIAALKDDANWLALRLDEVGRACPSHLRAELSQRLAMSGISYRPFDGGDSSELGAIASSIPMRTPPDDPRWQAAAEHIPSTLDDLREGVLVIDATLVTALVRVMARTDPERILDLLEDPQHKHWPEPSRPAVREYLATVCRIYGFDDVAPLDAALRLDALGLVNRQLLTTLVNENKFGGSSPLCNWALGQLAPEMDPEALRGVGGSDPRAKRFFNLFIEGPEHPATRMMALAALRSHGSVLLQSLPISRLPKLAGMIAALSSDEAAAVLNGEPFARPNRWGLGPRFAAAMIASLLPDDQPDSLEHTVRDWGIRSGARVYIHPLVQATAAFAGAAYGAVVAEHVEDSPLMRTVESRVRTVQVPQPRELPFSVGWELPDVLLTEAQLRSGELQDLTAPDVLAWLAFDFPTDSSQNAQHWRDELEVADARSLMELVSELTLSGTDAESLPECRAIVAQGLPTRLLPQWFAGVYSSGAQSVESPWSERRKAAFTSLRAVMHPDGKRFGLISARRSMRPDRQLAVLNAYADVLKGGHRGEIEACLRYARRDLAMGSETYFLLECYFAATKKENRLDDWEAVVRRYLVDPSGRDVHRRMSAGLWVSLIAGALSIGIEDGHQFLLRAVTELRRSSVPDSDRQFSVGELGRVLMTMPRSAPYLRAESTWLSIADSDETVDSDQRLARFLEILGSAHMQANRPTLVHGDDAEPYSVAAIWQAAFGEPVPHPVVSTWQPLAAGFDQSFDQGLPDDVFHRVATLTAAIARLLRHDLQGIINPARAVVAAIENGNTDIALRNARFATSRAGEVIGLLDLIRGDSGDTSTNIRSSLADHGFGSEDIEWQAPPTVLMRLPSSIVTYALHELLDNARKHGSGGGKVKAVVTFDPFAGTYGSVNLMIVDAGSGIDREAVDERGWIMPADNPDLKDDRALTTLNHALIAAGGRLLAQEYGSRLFPVIKGPATRPRTHEEKVSDE